MLQSFACEAPALCEQGLGEYLFSSRLERDEAVNLTDKPPSVRALAIQSSMRDAAFAQQVCVITITFLG